VAYHSSKHDSSNRSTIKTKLHDIQQLNNVMHHSSKRDFSDGGIKLPQIQQSNNITWRTIQARVIQAIEVQNKTTRYTTIK